MLQIPRHRNTPQRLSRLAKIRIRAQPTARPMRCPFVLQQVHVRQNVAERLWITRPRRIRTILGIASVRVLRPQPMQHKPRMRRTLHSLPMRQAKLRRPRQRQQVIIKHTRRSIRLRATPPLRVIAPSPLAPLAAIPLIDIPPTLRIRLSRLTLSNTLRRRPHGRLTTRAPSASQAHPCCQQPSLLPHPAPRTPDHPTILRPTSPAITAASRSTRYDIQASNSTTIQEPP
jgi:hypothetical protein